MDQAKIGNFIQECRKKKNLTQVELAEALNITDRAVSKWENGKSMPDSSIMLELCKILGITVNDLLSGEVVSVENYEKENEKLLLQMAKEKEIADKRLLTSEIFIGFTSTIILFALILVATFVQMSNGLKIGLIAIGFVLFLAGCLYALRLEQVAGYYKCEKCGHTHVPTFKSMLFARHIGRTRHLRCPSCGKKSWQKKTITKD